MKRLLSCLAAAIMLMVSLRTPVSAVEVHTSARACVLYCVNNGAFLISDNADERLPMASTTKIMTALLTLEAAAEDNRVITFTEEMTAEGSSMYLNVGDRLTLYDLAVGMLMQSGNDAANAAAISLAGSTEAFAERMNAKAKTLGMKDTHFVTPSGLDAEGHCSTAHDMALLMAAAMENADFASITGRTRMTVTFASPPGKSETYPNHNKLLSRYTGCIGGKTGYTDAAGRCLVTCAERDGLRLIAVTLDDGDDWDDHAALYDSGFASYTLYSPGTVTVEADVVGGATDSVTVESHADPLVIPREEGNLQKTVYLPAFLYAPVARGEEVGRVVYIDDDRIVAEAPLLACGDVAYNSRRRSLWQYIKDQYHWHN